MKKMFKFLIFLFCNSFLYSTDCSCCLVEEYYNENISHYPFYFFDFSSNNNQPLFYRYAIKSDSCPKDVVVDIEYKIYSPAIGINSYQIFYKGEFLLDENPTIKYFTNNSIQLTSQTDILGNQKLESLYSYISQSGTMPNGKYQINISLKVGDEIIFVLPSNFFEIDKPITLELLSPGGPIENISNSFIYNSTPLFTWYMDYCQLCDYAIRISEYNKEEHSSLEDALNDWSLIPSDQSQRFEKLSSMAQSFQYPSDGHLNLKKGKYYVWQIKRSYNNLFDIQEDYSDIFIFEIRSLDKLEFEKLNSSLTVLESILGLEEFNLLFGPGGELESFTPSSDYIELNGNLINIDALYAVLAELESGKAKLEGVRVK